MTNKNILLSHSIFWLSLVIVLSFNNFNWRVDSKQNNNIVTSGLCDKGDDGEKNMTSDALPPNNPLGILHNRVDIEKEKEE